MRHSRLSTNNPVILSSFKAQFANLFEKMNALNEDDKKEAISYIQKLIADANFENNVLEKDLTPTKENNNNNEVKAKVFRCAVCSEIKKTQSSLLRHADQHTGIPISCWLCRQTFNNLISFNFHLHYFCKKRTTEYSVYHQKFTVRKRFKVPLREHKPNKCSYCDVVLYKRDQLKQHMVKIHKIEFKGSLLNCQHCDKRYLRKQSLYRHLNQHYPNKFVCLSCGEVLDNSDEYNKHIENHDNQKPWQCSQCNKKFFKKQQYLYHLKRHDLTCKDNIVSKADAIKHNHLLKGLGTKRNRQKQQLQTQISKHIDAITTSHCQYCNKVFYSPHQYYKHCKMSTHCRNVSDINLFICEKCGKRFRKKCLIKQHLKQFHRNSSFFSCKYCDYKTRFKLNLTRHLNLHFSDKKQFMCDHCGKSFSNIGGLTDHIDYNHLQEKQFKCEKCDKSFKRKSELIRHRTCHSDARPYSCSLCDHTYKRINHLRRHEKNVHKLPIKHQKLQRFKIDTTGKAVPLPYDSSKEYKKMKKVEITVPTVSEPITQSLPILLWKTNEFMLVDKVGFNQCNMSFEIGQTDTVNNPLTLLTTSNTNEAGVLQSTIMNDMVTTIQPSRDLQILNNPTSNYISNVLLDVRVDPNMLTKGSELIW